MERVKKSFDKAYQQPKTVGTREKSLDKAHQRPKTVRTQEKVL
ncbi:hypothetical protein [Neobacillus massiliamazoniensis]|nr:hypothetical protein [Neobacillus massiliamazoniensis]